MADGTNYDDLKAYRPGLKALRELGIKSPLAEAGLTKDDIRKYSKKMGLPTWDAPALACLATRIPYDEEITEVKLKMIDESEELSEEPWVQAAQGKISLSNSKDRAGQRKSCPKYWSRI